MRKNTLKKKKKREGRGENPEETCIWKGAQHHMSKIKTKMRYHYTPIEIDNTYGYGTTGTLSFMAGGNANWYSHFQRWFGSFLQKQTYSYHMTQESFSLIFTQVNWKLCTHTNPAQQIFIAVLFIVAKTWKTCPRCLSVNEEINCDPSRQ